MPSTWQLSRLTFTIQVTMLHISCPKRQVREYATTTLRRGDLTRSSQVCARIYDELKNSHWPRHEYRVLAATHSHVIDIMPNLRNSAKLQHLPHIEREKIHPRADFSE
jgi:hypothetical protein